MSKPDFKRAEQDLASYSTGVYKGKSSMMASMMGKKAFTKRYFVLESSSLKYVAAPLMGLHSPNPPPPSGG